MKAKMPEIVEVDQNRVEELLHTIEDRLPEEEAKVVTAIVKSYIFICGLLRSTTRAHKHLLKILFGSKSEKTKDVLGNSKDANSTSAPAAEVDAEPGTPESSSGDESEEADTATAPNDATSNGTTKDSTTKDEPPPGHGRNGADAFTGATHEYVPHESLEPGSPCPECDGGTLYEFKPPGVVVHIVGGAPLSGNVYRLQKLRCNLCGTVFTAQAPVSGGSRVYDETAAAMIALLRYGSGLPFHRLEVLQRNLGIPLPASTQWDIVNSHVGRVTPVYRELVRQAAQGRLLHNDDTTARILALMGKRKEKQKGNTARSVAEMGREDVPEDRTGIFTSGIVAVSNGHRIALFFTGRWHAGENLTFVLKQRAAQLAAPILMCDGLSRNLPKELEVILSNCLAHGRRHFVDVVDDFPDECGFVLESLKVIYGNDAKARQKNLSPEQRLNFHQQHSSRTMDDLHAWLRRQLDDKLVEPNSGLGGAIKYMLERWDALTLFLREAGAPLDNNICERTLKKAILHRRNSLFYKTLYGGLVGDTYMSLIYTCELCDVNPLDYLVQLFSHADEIERRPETWMPWNYRQNLAAAEKTA